MSWVDTQVTRCSLQQVEQKLWPQPVRQKLELEEVKHMLQTLLLASGSSSSVTLDVCQESLSRQAGNPDKLLLLALVSALQRVVSVGLTVLLGRE